MDKGKHSAWMIVAGVAAVSGFHFGERSKLNLDGVHPALKQVAERCLELSPIDFMVIDGVRTEEEQKANIAKGVSWTMKSRHLEGKAIDIVALIDNKVTYDPQYYVKIAEACNKASLETKVPVIWGGGWKQKDWGHWELDRKVYP